MPPAPICNNSKTGYSINTWTCKPDPICAAYCYRFKRSKTQALEIERRCGFNPGSNNGPITWDVQQAAYRRNEAMIKAAAADGTLDEMACRIVRFMSNKREHLRWCGTGDLFPELCELITLVALKGCPSFGFSRDAEMMHCLASLLDATGVHGAARPFFIGSTDSSTPRWDVRDRCLASGCVNEGATALAYATWKRGVQAAEEMIHLPWHGHLHVVFGLHSTGLGHTATGLQRACPATEGSAIKCVDCRRCYGEKR